MLKSFQCFVLAASLCGLSAQADESFNDNDFVDSAAVTEAASPSDLIYLNENDDADVVAQPIAIQHGGKSNGLFSISEIFLGDNSPFRNARVYFGMETYRGTLDTSYVNPPANGIPAVGAGFSNSAGLSTGVSTTLPIYGRIRGQFGGSFATYDLRGRDVGNVRQQEENRGFFTTGIYKRGDLQQEDPVSWGIVYDHLWAYQSGFNGNGDYKVGQIRGLLGIALTDRNELGFWFTTRCKEDFVNANIGQLRGVNQYNLYLRHLFDFGGTGMIYFGGVDHLSAASWDFGGQFTAPLSKHVGLYTNGAFLMPSTQAGSIGSDQLLWSLGGGLVFTFGDLRAASVTGNPVEALLPVANNGSFVVTTTRNDVP